MDPIFKSDEKITVTQPYLPPLDEVNEYLTQIWESKWITNNGQFHRELEKKLAEYLNVPHVVLFSNGTLALLTALQVLNIEGEVITTPFSFVATTHALWWNKITPVFADIESKYFNLDPEKVERAITANTKAIMPVHVYGNPCNVERFKEIADKYNLKLIYDAAHAFGVKKDGNSVLNFGDLSILSFHATKVFNTFEGGAIICHDEETKKQINYLKNFGFQNETTVVAPGINAKMNEFQAAIGLLQLKKIDHLIHKRKKISDLYKDNLKEINGIACLKHNDNIEYNYSYFPIFINENKYGKSRDDLYDLLKERNYYCRRYFYPLISDFSMYNSLESASPENLIVANNAAKEVLCLPIYPELSYKHINNICEIIKVFSL